MCRFFSLLVGAAPSVVARCSDVDRQVLQALGDETLSLVGKKCGIATWSVPPRGRIAAFDGCFINEVGVSSTCAQCFGNSVAYGAFNCVPSCSQGWCQASCVNCTQPAQDALDACTGLERQSVPSLSRVCVGQGEEIETDWDLTDCSLPTPMSTDIAWSPGEMACVSVKDVYPDAEAGQVFEVSVYPKQAHELPKAVQLTFRFAPTAGSVDVECSEDGGCAWSGQNPRSPDLIKPWVWLAAIAIGGLVFACVGAFIVVHLGRRRRRKQLEVNQRDTMTVSLQPLA